MSSCPSPNPVSRSAPMSPPLTTMNTPTRAITTPPTAVRVRRCPRKTAAATAMTAGLNALMSEALKASLYCSAA
ncbi:hypothetical protein ACFPRL_19065 [Pseudoclavibacter helvolus]